MKRPKQQSQAFSFLNFFSRKPKTDPKSEKPAAALNRDEVVITLTPNEQKDVQNEPPHSERDGGGDVAETGSIKADGAEVEQAVECVSSGSMGVVSLSSSSQEQLLEHLVECPLCLLSQPRAHFPRLSSCPHRACTDCLRQYLRIEISESRVGIACPQCPEALAPPDVRAILDDSALLERFEEFQLRRFLASDPDTRWCPAPDCSYAVIAYGCAECPKLSCGREGCDTEFCYHCRQLWHPDQTCDQARRQRARHTLGSNDASALYIFSEEPGGGTAQNVGVTQRPSGCTFWGKKPWSQTRKVLWQVGMLLGAPVVISLIAGIAIPVIIVGIPIYMGRRVHGRCKKNNISGSKHYLTVASGVMTSVFVSPVLAAVTVAVGVPLMLTYVYGVVPMSLCRNGWCRPQNEAPETRKIQLEDLANYFLFSHVVSDHWTVQPKPTLNEIGLQEVSVDEAVALPSTSAVLSQPEGSSNLCDDVQVVSSKQDKSDDVDAVKECVFSSTQTFALREGTNIEVRVEIEAQPRGGRQPSLSSVLSSRSLSAESLRQSHDPLSASQMPVNDDPQPITQTDNV
ncbi:E3 ubiquitin-protein ligase RNF19A isoform X3 [Tachysurus ichikawai]